MEKPVKPPARRRKFISVQALADRWDVSESTVRRMIDEGSISGMKVRGSYKISLDSVEAYEQSSAF